MVVVEKKCVTSGKKENKGVFKKVLLLLYLVQRYLSNF